MTLSLFVANYAAILPLMTVLWIVSVAKRNVSIVDPFWSIAFLIPTVRTALGTGLSEKKIALLLAVTLWSLRLFVHLFVRGLGKPEDPRYAAFRQRYGERRYWWFSFFQVFVLQGTLAALISLPLQITAAAPVSAALSIVDWVGLSLFALGFLCEAIADEQLRRFRALPKDPNRVLCTGLWRYSRHPNYFGEALLGFGLWLLSVDQPGGWLSVLAPIAMTFLLVKVSGVAMLDAYMTKTRPAYADYVRRTSAFVPFWPRPSQDTGRL